MNRTDVIATRSIPVIGGWRCSICGAPNVSTGKIKIYGFSSVNSTMTSRIRLAEKRARDQIDMMWRPMALSMISKNKRDVEMYYEGFAKIDECYCIDCGRSEVWARTGLSKPIRAIRYISILVIILAVIAMIEQRAPTLRDIVIILISGSVIGSGYLIEKIYHKRFNLLPDESIPQLTSFNEELVEYAASLFFDITDERFVPLVYEGIEYRELKKRKKKKTRSNGSTKAKTKMATQQQNETDYAEETLFCYKCGKHIRNDSVFCSYCGAKIKER